MKMSRDVKLAIMKDRANKLVNRGQKNIKAPGVLRKLTRKIYKAEA
jgi:hypothetical protein